MMQHCLKQVKVVSSYYFEGFSCIYCQTRTKGSIENWDEILGNDMQLSASKGCSFYACRWCNLWQPLLDLFWAKIHSKFILHLIFLQWVYFCQLLELIGVSFLKTFIGLRDERLMWFVRKSKKEGNISVPGSQLMITDKHVSWGSMGLKIIQAD